MPSFLAYVFRWRAESAMRYNPVIDPVMMKVKK